jgi:hypothetical protein
MYLIPAQKLVVVRMIEGSKDYNEATVGFDEMWSLVKPLIRWTKGKHDQPYSRHQQNPIIHGCFQAFLSENHRQY